MFFGTWKRSDDHRSHNILRIEQGLPLVFGQQGTARKPLTFSLYLAKDESTH